MYTIDSPLMGTRQLNIISLADRFSSMPYAYYTYVAWYEILGHYNNFCLAVNINAELVVAQMLHETYYGRSWWSARPRRNPAGIRVNGEQKPFLSSADNPKEWQLKEDEGLYKRGLAFPSWRISSATHIGHLLCYMYYDHEMNEIQFRFSEYSPNKPLLNKLRYRGVAKTVKGLNKRWAVGDQYAQAITRTANHIFV